ncbi:MULTISPECIES: hypothetical protein [unclassified Streptomyces]|uniref:hypothetical protein n=1 Tax=unclassified Streptomyces TaxID=2593676 RepID=UPI002E22896C|nr:hypothetical protein OG217_06510 [Streptomyces sp. NBC_01023]
MAVPHSLHGRLRAGWWRQQVGHSSSPFGVMPWMRGVRPHWAQGRWVAPQEEHSGSPSAVR